MLCCIVGIVVHGSMGSWRLPPLWTKVSSAGQMCVDCNDPYGSTGYRCQATSFSFPCKQKAYSPGLCWGRQGETSLYVCEQKAKKRCSNEFFTDHIPMSQAPSPFSCCLSCTLTEVWGFNLVKWTERKNPHMISFDILPHLGLLLSDMLLWRDC